MLPDERLHPLQIERFRQMTSDEKHAVLNGMIRTARQIKRAALRQQQPHLTEAQLDRALARVMLHGSS